MASVSFQFHATPGELVELAAAWAEREGLAVVAERFFPDYLAVAAPSGRLRAAVEELDGVDRIGLDLEPFDAAATSAHDLVTRNGGALFVAVGTAGEAGLRESIVSADTDDPDRLALWRRLIKEARASTAKGATVRDPLSGASRRAPSHRYTAGARELSRAGTKMLAFAGNAEFAFDD